MTNKEAEIDYIRVLKSTLKTTIPMDRYSIGKYKEESICIESDGNKWIVYDGERGQKHNMKVYKHPKYACRELISRVSRSMVEKRKVKKIFSARLRMSRMQYEMLYPNFRRKGIFAGDRVTAKKASFAKTRAVEKIQE